MGNGPFRELTASEFEKLTVQERQKYMRELMERIAREKKEEADLARERAKNKL